nr:RNA-binding protein 1-like [Coffea arabica]
MEDSSDQCKLFVGGVSWEATEDVLREHFAKYGTVLSSVIAKDRLTGTSRGFAFVSFSDAAAVDLALQDSHEIRGRTVEVKKAIPRGEQHQSKQPQSRGLGRNNRTDGSRSDNQFRTKKIFVGGLSANLTEEEFKSYFEKFGRITDVVVMHDNVTHRPRGFGFITFASEDAVEEVVQNNFHHLNDKLVEVKRAIPKEGNNNVNGHSGRADNGRGSNYNLYPQGTYPLYNPRFGMFPSYSSVPGYGGLLGYPYGPTIYGGNYPFGTYMGVGYGVVPLPGSWVGGATADNAGGSDYSTIYP